MHEPDTHVLVHWKGYDEDGNFTIRSKRVEKVKLEDELRRLRENGSRPFVGTSVSKDYTPLEARS